MVIFHSYVKLPEGIVHIILRLVPECVEHENYLANVAIYGQKTGRSWRHDDLCGCEFSYTVLEILAARGKLVLNLV